jgi:tetratricopeptide (TPR) repeat protein
LMNENSDIPRLKNIVYISVPETIETELVGLSIDPSILLPVELPPGDEELFLENLSWEMILAAMLKILAYDPGHEHAEYYRNFILHVKPDVVDELMYTGVLKAKNKDYSLSVEIFLALTSLLPENIEARINLALVYEERSKAYQKTERDDLAEEYRHKVMELYREIFEIDDSCPEAHFNAGYFYLHVEGYEKARYHFSIYSQVGTDGEKLEKVKKVVESIEERMGLDTLFKQAYDFIKLGKEEEGINRIREFLQESPHISNAWFLLGWAFRRLGRYKDGKEAFLQAIELEKPHTDVLNELAICLMELGEFEESKKNLEKALREEPENVKIISNLGILALKKDKKEEALGFFRSVLEIDPNDPIAKKYINTLT